MSKTMNARTVFLSLSLMIMTIQLQADEDQTLDDQGTLDEISGIVVDRTITLIGGEFYRHFSNYMLLNQPDFKYNLTIHERPSARWGSLIWVEYQSKKLNELFLNPGKSSSYQIIAENTARQVDKKIQTIKLRELLSDRYDLDADEF